EPVEVDPLALLRDLVGEATLAPVIDLDDLAAHAFDHALDAGVDLGDAVVRRVRAQDVDRLVFARRVRRVAQALQSCHVIPLGCKAPGGARRGRVYITLGRPLYLFIAAVSPPSRMPSIASQ